MELYKTQISSLQRNVMLKTMIYVIIINTLIYANEFNVNQLFTKEEWNKSQNLPDSILKIYINQKEEIMNEAISLFKQNIVIIDSMKINNNAFTYFNDTDAELLNDYLLIRKINPMRSTYRIVYDANYKLNFVIEILKKYYLVNYLKKINISNELLSFSGISEKRKFEIINNADTLLINDTEIRYAFFVNLPILKNCKDSTVFYNKIRHDKPLLISWILSTKKDSSLHEISNIITTLDFNEKKNIYTDSQYLKTVMQYFINKISQEFSRHITENDIIKRQDYLKNYLEKYAIYTIKADLNKFAVCNNNPKLCADIDFIINRINECNKK